MGGRVERTGWSMCAGVELATTVVACFGLAGIFHPALVLDRRPRLVILVALVPFALLSPAWISADQPFLRFLGAVCAVVVIMKLYDVHLGAHRGDVPDWRTFLVFLPNLASVVLRKLDDEPRPGREEDLIRLSKASLAACAAILGMVGVFQVDWRAYPFAVEHCVKVLGAFLILVPTTAAAASGLRLLGQRVREPMDNPFLSSTPADFWRRYNRPVTQFLYEDVFRPVGGRRSPIRATLVTFAVSGVLHEYIFDLSVRRIQGYQLAFFLIQGLAVAATMRLRPRGWRTFPWIVGTLAFNLTTGTLFFASVNEILPFYVARTS